MKGNTTMQDTTYTQLLKILHEECVKQEIRCGHPTFAANLEMPPFLTIRDCGERRYQVIITGGVHGTGFDVVGGGRSFTAFELSAWQMRAFVREFAFGNPGIRTYDDELGSLFDYNAIPSGSHVLDLEAKEIWVGLQQGVFCWNCGTFGPKGNADELDACPATGGDHEDPAFRFQCSDCMKEWEAAEEVKKSWSRMNAAKADQTEGGA
jgi:hypothetical protein